MPGFLIADSAPACRAAIVRILSRVRPFPAPLVEVGNGNMAVAVARTLHPAIVFLDVHLPGLNGLDAGARIRAEHPQTRLVMLSADQEFAAARQALRIGASDYLLKPVRPAHVLEALERIQAADHVERAPVVFGASEVLPASSPLTRALGYIQHQLHRPDLRLSEVAQCAGLSASHLAALMRRELGRSYLDYLTDLRIERAKQLLRTTNCTVAAIAYAVGYATPAPFYQRFKQVVGTTPLGFRNQDH